MIKSYDQAKPAEDARGDTIYCDAIVSNAPGVLAGVKTADCVPILLGDPNTGAFAAVHAGWRGTLADIVTKALERMSAEYGSGSRDVCVAIGPAAGACCYKWEGRNADQKFLPAQIFHRTARRHACINLMEATCAMISADCKRQHTHTRSDDVSQLFFSPPEKNVHGGRELMS